MSEQSPEKEIGINREGKVLKRSWFAPLLFLGVAVMIFLVYGIESIEKEEANVPALIKNGWNEILLALRFQLETVSKLALYSLLPRPRWPHLSPGILEVVSGWFRDSAPNQRGVHHDGMGCDSRPP